MLGVAALASRPWPPSRVGRGYVVPEASHLTVTRDARPSRILRAAPQVMALPNVHYSNDDDFVSHPNDQVKLRGRLLGRCVAESRNGGPVNFNALFGTAPQAT